MGGAKIPVKQLSDDIIKKEQPQVPNSVSESPPAKTVVQKDVKLNSEGLRPGERLNRWQFIVFLICFRLHNICFPNLFRFKQLKEQEARRKKQNEEERRKAEEAADKSVQITNDEVNKVTEDSDHSKSTVSSSSSRIDGVAVNGNGVNSQVKNNEKASVDKDEYSEILDDRKNELHLDKNIEKV